MLFSPCREVALEKDRMTKLESSISAKYAVARSQPLASKSQYDSFIRSFRAKSMIRDIVS